MARFYSALQLLWPGGAIFVSILATTGALAWLVQGILFQDLERSYAEIQTEASARQAERISELLAREIRAGADMEAVRHRLQESLVRSPYDAAGFLCLLDSENIVICHPREDSLGMQVEFVDAPPGGRFDRRPLQTRDSPEWLLEQSYGGETQLVTRRLVEGTPWAVSVHVDYGAIEERIAKLRIAAGRTAIPGLLGFALLGTFVSRLIGRRYEGRIEEANRNLEEKAELRAVALARAEHKYETLFEEAPVAFIVCGENDEILRSNRMARDLFELDAGNGESRVNMSELIEWSDDDNLREGGFRQAVVRNHGADGVRFLETEERVMRDQDRARKLYAVKDVAERKLLREELVESHRMEALGMLAGGIAHDVNNTLAAIMGAAELAAMSTDGEKPRRYIGQILSTCRRAANLIRQLLAYSRKEPIAPERMVLNDVIRDVQSMLRRVLGEGITIQAECVPDLWPVMMDPHQFERILMNLAVNARDAMEGSGTLTIRTRNEADGGDDASAFVGERVIVEIDDTGPGIPEDLRSRIFEPFFTTKPRERGTGLGLASVQGIVTQHGGSMRAENVRPRGARFQLIFPRAPEQESGDDQRLESEPPASPRPVSSGKSVMIVEDDSNVGEVVRDYLQTRGYDAKLFLKRADALAELSSGLPHQDVVLADMVMPGMPLQSFVARLEQEMPASRILLMTGHADEVLLREKQPEQHYPVIRKPFGWDELIVMLEERV